MRRRLREIGKEVAFIAALSVVLLGARSSLADHYVVPSSSMEYTLMPGDRVLVDKTSYGLRLPFLGWELTTGRQAERGEVVVFDSPADGKRLIKRVVAVAGDLVMVRDGHLYIDGEPTWTPGDPLHERLGERRSNLNLSMGGGPDYGPDLVPAGHVLVMGDFRGNSNDGRVFGLVPESAIYGRATAVFLRRGEGLTWKPL